MPAEWNVDGEWKPASQPLEVWAGPKGWQTPPSRLVARVEGRGTPEGEAGARVIAAAPGMLETLREVSAQLEDHADAEGNSAADWVPNWAMSLQQEVDHAIFKAEGKS